MRLRRLTIAGFRGINTERTIDLHDRLTVISGPNSHGKTSISEALEFLIYGATSKVENAQFSKEEYKDSYRNRHYPADKCAYIVAELSRADGTATALRIELDASGALRRFLDSAPVPAWPFKATMDGASRPFILQHALKNLLLVPPAERFQGFAQLLGLNEVDGVHRALISLCTKPEANLPLEAKAVLDAFEHLVSRLDAAAELKKALASLKKGRAGIPATYRAIEERADAVIGGLATPEDRLAKLVKGREEVAARVFPGTVGLRAFSEAEAKQVATTRRTLESAVSAEFFDDYARLAGRGATERLREQAQLLLLGLPLLEQIPGQCPLCRQPLSAEIERHLRERHAEATANAEKATPLEQVTGRVAAALRTLRDALGSHRTLSELRSTGLLDSAAAANRDKVRNLLGAAAAKAMLVVETAAEGISHHHRRLKEAASLLDNAIGGCEAAVRSGREEIAQAKDLGKALNEYLACADALRAEEDRHDTPLVGVERQLRQAVDQLAGTTETSLLIDLIEKRSVVEKALHLRDLLDEVRQLKKHAEQTLSETMEAAMNADLTAAVMGWYAKIKTVGDPDVHFSGFAMEKTKAGDFKSRKLAVKATSYGVELASAVSSLSESKLNALGLCVSIANAIRAPGPWEFLMIDDPIQSWDDEHETQFIDVIRELIETEAKQIVVLSHKRGWADKVCKRCRTLNGLHYDITGYTKDGPQIGVLDWSTIDQRLREAEAIANDPGATPVRQQQAEEEIRLAACQIAASVADKRLGRPASAHDLNTGKVRTILIEAGFPEDLIDRVYFACSAADEAHHVPKKYTPNVQRVRYALASLREVWKTLR